jgi:alpha-amylase
VRDVAKDYLRWLSELGTAGYRFDAAKHIESSFFADVLSAVPGRYAFGEIIAGHRDELDDYLAAGTMDFYDFPLVATMRQAFGPGGDLRSLRDPAAVGRALEGTRAVTFVRNHDIDRGQNNDRGLDGPDGRRAFGVGWDEGQRRLDRTDVALAHAYIFGREDGVPYVFVDMNTLPPGEQDDRPDDPAIVAGIRFHNLSLAGTGGVNRRPDIWRIETPDVIGWQRGSDRFVVINKAETAFTVRDLPTSLQNGRYIDIRTGWELQVQPGGTIQHWDVPPRSAVMFVRLG